MAENRKVTIDMGHANLIGMMMATGSGLCCLASGVRQGRMTMAQFATAALDMAEQSMSAVSQEQVDEVQAFWARVCGFDIDDLDTTNPVILAAKEETTKFLNKHGIKREDGDS